MSCVCKSQTRDRRTHPLHARLGLVLSSVNSIGFGDSEWLLSSWRFSSHLPVILRSSWYYLSDILYTSILPLVWQFLFFFPLILTLSFSIDSMQFLGLISSDYHNFSYVWLLLRFPNLMRVVGFYFFDFRISESKNLHQFLELIIDSG